jgi:hypothetical protein
VKKMLRTIRLDPSDGFVFARAAEPGEWAVAGGFMFWDCDPAALAGKERAAFRSGILGIEPTRSTVSRRDSSRVSAPRIWRRRAPRPRRRSSTPRNLPCIRSTR